MGPYTGLGKVTHNSVLSTETKEGKIVELAEAEELFLHPLHPYTKSLMAAIPIPDPILEKKKKVLTYQCDVSEYEKEDVEFVEILYGHFVLGNPEQINNYRKELMNK